VERRWRDAEPRCNLIYGQLRVAERGPPALVVSMSWVRQRKSIPRRASSSTVLMSCCVERAKRSSFQTTRVSLSRR
jgi:hypothetical protein